MYIRPLVELLVFAQPCHRRKTKTLDKMAEELPTSHNTPNSRQPVPVELAVLPFVIRVGVVAILEVINNYNSSASDYYCRWNYAYSLHKTLQIALLVESTCMVIWIVYRLCRWYKDIQSQKEPGRCAGRILLGGLSLWIWSTIWAFNHEMELHPLCPKP